MLSKTITELDDEIFGYEMDSEWTHLKSLGVLQLRCLLSDNHSVLRDRKLVNISIARLVPSWVWSKDLLPPWTTNVYT